ncbi:hypothetical protein OHB35_11350 [Streptomyces phaeochromogenes]|uniref:ATP-binding protein n=1 Tax=Streptomyces phaeochromogenes TaxID=1923 RepID=A0ABZ1H836_STRPH|nr:hypothetical protein [Streptomyces phaeochromogenes]WSD13788.1 hypothetical protein OHB35_11350 [Streptomyces phaeochromogenes]
MTFERRLAATFLVRLLVGAPAAEMGPGRLVTQVLFQQAPQRAVDDVVVRACHPDAPDDEVELLVAVRRSPKLVASDDKSEQLVTQLLRVTTQPTTPAQGWTVAVAVAGPQTAAGQLSDLAHHARNQTGPDGFFTLINTPGKFSHALRERLRHLEKLVATGLRNLSAPGDEEAARQSTFDLLSQLVVLQPRLENPDDSDWQALTGQLQAAARDGSVPAAVQLRDRLETLTATYGPTAADVNATALRRDVHDLLDSTFRRSTRAWTVLEQLDADWRGSLRHAIGCVGDDGPALSLERTGARAALRSAVDGAPKGLVVWGYSGVGKSASLVHLFEPGRADQRALGLNLRHLPQAPMELTASLGVPLDQALAEITVPQRVLVVDGADAAAEKHADMLTHVLHAARAADVTPVVVVSEDVFGVVRDLTFRTMGTTLPTHQVKGLDDGEVEAVAAAFPALRRLVDNPQARELLRRPAVADFLVRAHTDGVPLSEADTMREVWHHMVRRGERTDRGRPDLRERVLLQLARQQLDNQSAETVLDMLDAEAVAGLRRDGLLRPAGKQPWQLLPSFAHDLMRTYALAHLLLTDGRPGNRLADSGAPRWALPAARLACQALLSDFGEAPERPLAQRFLELHEQFSALAADGFGGRWMDVPAEALLTAGYDAPRLSDAWVRITGTVPGAAARFLRLLKQRHQHAGVLDPLVASAVVACLLEHGSCGADPRDVAEAIREWEVALVMADTAAGHPLRVRLRDQLVRRCRDAIDRLAAEERERQAQLDARTPEEVAADEEQARRHAAIVGPEYRRRGGRTLPHELIDDTMVEKLALLGLDLGEEAAQLLHDVAEHAPQHLAPALEEAGAGRALAQYSPELLRALVRAYYIEEPWEDLDPFETFFNDGIRHHHWRGPIVPMAAYYRGPFLVMLQVGFREGVAVINTMLNAAARHRVAALTAPSYGSDQRGDRDDYEVRLTIGATEHCFYGDEHVWAWYRGISIGPYPCTSALQALEFVCDQFIARGAPPAALVPLLFDGCENLAMAGLVVGMLVRHVEAADAAIDPFLAEPAFWDLEFSRAASETGSIAEAAPGIAHLERRRWNLREAAMHVTVQADDARREQLRQVGQHLVDRARLELEQLRPHPSDKAGQAEDLEAAITTRMAAVRGWAATLDAAQYRFEQLPDGNVQFQVVPPGDVLAVLEPGNEDLLRGGRAMGLAARYGRQGAVDERVSADELEQDIAAARALSANPPRNGPSNAQGAPAAVAAYVVQAALIHRDQLKADDVRWAAELLLAVAEDAVCEERDAGFAIFSWGADRSAACVLPLLLLPQAALVRQALDLDGERGQPRLQKALRALATQSALQVRLFLAAALDPLWSSPCTPDPCHHRRAWSIVEDSGRRCARGKWNMEHQRSEPRRLDGNLSDALTAIRGAEIIVPYASAAIRAAAPAALYGCRTAEAAQLLESLLDAHRRGLIAQEERYQHSASDALVAARALLTVSSATSRDAIERHLTAYADDAAALAEFLRAVAAAAEETATLAAAGQRAWPHIMDHVLDLFDAGHVPDTFDYRGAQALAALVPTTAYDAGYVNRELHGPPQAWTRLLEWGPQIQRWLPYATGVSECVDNVVSALQNLSPADQVRVGLPWLETLITARPDAVAGRSWLLPKWLRDVRGHARNEFMQSWQRIVDALVVAGETRLSDLAD